LVSLETPFSAEEIKFAVWDCDGNKAPALIVLISSLLRKHGTS